MSICISHRHNHLQCALEYHMLEGSQFNLPPTRLSINGMNHLAFTP